jgi:hypothetical protein
MMLYGLNCPQALLNPNEDLLECPDRFWPRRRGCGWAERVAVWAAHAQKKMSELRDAIPTVSHTDLQPADVLGRGDV